MKELVSKDQMAMDALQTALNLTQNQVGLLLKALPVADLFRQYEA